ncbi:hypothetical protein R1flu_017631 [Riccia fluitans]|uniref:Uncharacterized protein n=1 Tax=Riccia fluitans TaxID=41844 RepID=A0ABD1ZDT1_9MARC
MEAEGGVAEVEAGNMEAEEGVTEPHLEEAADHEGGITEAKEVAGEMECTLRKMVLTEQKTWFPDWDFRNLVVLPTERRVEHESHDTDDFYAGRDHETLSDTLAIGDVFVVKADDEEIEYWLLRCIARKHKITKKEVRCPWNTEHIFT